jgi:hypothetical protein
MKGAKCTPREELTLAFATVPHRYVGPLRVITHRSPNVSFQTSADQVADREGEKVP